MVLAMKKALIISGEGFEDTELLVPYYRLLEEGLKVDIASPAVKFKGKHGYEVSTSVPLDKANAKDYDVLILPGGKAPASLRDDARVTGLAREFVEAGKPVAAICHGPQVLVSAGVMDGRTSTCYKTVRKEVEGAGAKYKDEEVVVDGNLVTSRQPGDLPAFMREIMKKLR
jgi:protease I